MPGDGRTVARTITVIVLVLLAIVALRGYLPGAEQTSETREPSEGSGSLIAVLAMLVVSMAVIALSLLRRPPPRRAGPTRTELPGDGRRDGLPWRPLLLAAAALLTWLAVLYLLLRWASPQPVDPPPPAPAADPPVPSDTTPAERPDPAPVSDSGGDLFGILAVTTAVLIVIVIVAAIRGRRRPATVTPSAATDSHDLPAPASDPDLARAAELGLAEIGDLSRDPPQAIIACYAAMERELGKAPGASPKDSDTPAEVLARAIDTQVLRSGSAGELVDLFEEARFSSHVMDEGHRADAVHALKLVQRELAGAS